MNHATRRETLVGLHVTDDEGYSKYRAAMTPLLTAAGGSFHYDFKIQETLIGPTDPPINRLFVISFPDEATMGRFFADPKYVAAKEEFFESSVDSVNIMATFEHPVE